MYALRPNPVTGTIDEDSEVQFESKYGWSFLEQALTLWQLVGSTRAEEIERIMLQVERDPEIGELRLYAPELSELVRLLTGVEDAIVAAGIVDHEWRVPEERLDELAKQVPGMDLKTERSIRAKTFALAEVMLHAESIRMFLSKALENGCVVAVG
jgi:ATP phosphoribosyltransferase